MDKISRYVDTMNIYSEEGDKVVFAFPDNGYDSDIEKCKKHLVVGRTYTIDYTEVGGSHTDVHLVEFPNVRFNSVNFADLKDYEDYMNAE